MIALVSMLTLSNAQALPTADLDMQMGAFSTGAMGLAGMEYSNASIARVIETLLDSGASRIMLHDEDLFTNLYKAQYPLQVQYADGVYHTYWYKGQARLPIRDALTKETKLLEFDDAWLTDKAVFNLISVHALTKVGYEVIFNKQGAVIKGNGVEINVGSENRLYFLDLVHEDAPTETACGAKEEAQTLELWHARLSHVGFTQLEACKDERVTNCWHDDYKL